MSHFFLCISRFLLMYSFESLGMANLSSILFNWNQKCYSKYQLNLINHQSNEYCVKFRNHYQCL